MKERIVTNPIVFGALLFSFVLAIVYGRPGAQAQVSADKAPLVQKTSASSKRPDSRISEKPAEYSRFSQSSFENARLRNSLQWSFGGKSQIGWNLYTLLIGETVGSDSPPESAEFAAALSEWQSGSGLPSTGILDLPTLEAFIKTWQSRRQIGTIGPGANQVISAPISDVYDPSRAAKLLQLDREAYAAYKSMIAAAIKDLSADLKLTKNGELAAEEKFLRIVSGFRSPEYQAQLRKREPNAGRGALAKRSVHSTGRAIDIYVGGEPVMTKDANRAIQVQTPVYKWLVENAHRFGFYPYFYEPWHWEYVPGK